MAILNSLKSLSLVNMRVVIYNMYKKCLTFLEVGLDGG